MRRSNMTPEMWHTIPADPVAVAWLREYPHPKALREAMRERSLRDIIPTSLLTTEVRFDDAVIPLSEYIVEATPREAADIHRAIAVHARASRVWVAADGTRTYLEGSH